MILHQRVPSLEIIDFSGKTNIMILVQKTLEMVSFFVVRGNLH